MDLFDRKVIGRSINDKIDTKNTVNSKFEDAFPGFEAQTSAEVMARYVYEFSVMDPILLNGKVVPVSNSTP